MRIINELGRKARSINNTIYDFYIFEIDGTDHQHLVAADEYEQNPEMWRSIATSELKDRQIPQ